MQHSALHLDGASSALGDVLEHASGDSRMPVCRVGLLHVGGEMLQPLYSSLRYAEQPGATEVLSQELLDVSLLQLDAGEELAGDQVARIDHEHPVRPENRLVIPALIPTGV